MTFLTTSPPLARALAERNYDEATPVQTAVLAADAEGRDLLVSAQTGSGKTVAYGLAMAKDLLGEAERFGRAAAPLALIVAPTRELALQVQRELDWLYRYTGARVVSCVGGMDPRAEQRELGEGAHIVVGTPGRLCDHLRRRRLDVSELKVVVLDEADEMLDLGFREDMEFILKTTPETRRTLLFSATLPRTIVGLAKEYQRQAVRIGVAGTEGGHADIEYRAIRIAPGDVEHVVVNLLRFYEAPATLVFCNTRNAVNHLQTALLERGFSVVALSGELSQTERTHALQALRDGRARVCVATDVAARGIDLPNLGLVIHAEFPNDPEVLQHRSGRTGRAGKKGISVMLVAPHRRRRAELLLSSAGIEAVWDTAPKPEAIHQLDQERMLGDALFTAAPSDDDLALARTLLATRSGEEIATALARLYRSRLPSPEDIRDPGDGFRARDGRVPASTRSEERGPRLKPSARGLSETSVWFRAGIGREGKAEARWLLPMICRRGGVSRQDIGAIRIYGTMTEFEIAGASAEQFSASIKRPDKDDAIRIERLAGGPEGDAYVEKAPQPDPQSTGEPRPPRPRPPSKPYDFKAAHRAKAREERRPNFRDKPQSGWDPSAAKDPPGFKKKPRHAEAAADVGKRRGKDVAAADKPAFARKPRNQSGG